MQINFEAGPTLSSSLFSLLFSLSSTCQFALSAVPSMSPQDAQVDRRRRALDILDEQVQVVFSDPPRIFHYILQRDARKGIRVFERKDGGSTRKMRSRPAPEYSRTARASPPLTASNPTSQNPGYRHAKKHTGNGSRSTAHSPARSSRTRGSCRHSSARRRTALQDGIEFRRCGISFGEAVFRVTVVVIHTEPQRRNPCRAGLRDDQPGPIARGLQQTEPVCALQKTARKIKWTWRRQQKLT